MSTTSNGDVAKKDRKTGNPSGFTDTLPGEKMLFNRLMETLSHVVESYGFSPIDTPEIEWIDTLTGHDDTGGKLIYRVFNGYETPESATEYEKVMDKGLRFDLTVPLARFFGQHMNELPLPFRRYHWGKVFRGESAQTGKGRYREFYQFDADSVGAQGSMADAEVAAMLVDAMRRLELPAVVKINNRRLLDGLVELGGISEAEQKSAIFIAIDKFDKVGAKTVVADVTELAGAEFGQLVSHYLEIGVTGSTQDRLAALETLLGGSSAAKEGLAHLREMTDLLTAAGYGLEIHISPEIVRGLGYYTGAIFETYVAGYEKYGSVASGGRYDNLIADLGGPEQPAVGASFGVSRLLDVLQAAGWQSQTQTPAQVLIVNFGVAFEEKYFELAAQLRRAGISTLVYGEAKKIGQQLKYAAELGIPKAILIGEDELKRGVAVIKNLETRQQEEVSVSELIHAF